MSHNKGKKKQNKKKLLDMKNEDFEDETCQNISCLQSINKLKKQNQEYHKLYQEAIKQCKKITEEYNELRDSYDELQNMMKSKNEICLLENQLQNTLSVEKSKCHDASSEDYFLPLSDEIMLNIFQMLPQSFLSVCSNVCSRWTRLCYDSSLWTTVKLDCQVISIEDIKLYLSVGVQNLSFNDTKVVKNTPSSVFNNFNNFWGSKRVFNLKQLDLRGVEIDNPLLTELFLMCHNLEDVNLGTVGLNAENCFAIAQNKNLKKLDVYSIYGPYSEGFFGEILKNCKKLESLSFRHPTCKFALNVVALCFPSSLKYLHLSYVFPHKSAGDECFKEILQSCPNITHLYLKFCYGLSVKSVHFIVTYLTKLQHLSIRGVERSFSKELHLLGKLKSLTEIHLLDFEEKSFVDLLRKSLDPVKIITC